MRLPKVLCVDDEPRVLEGLENTLGMDYEVLTGGGGAEGLEVLAREAESDHPVAAVISDMRMPGMTGAEFLSVAAERYPDATRMLLTGQADLDAAIAAVNRGRIFRFLLKPCEPDDLVAAVEEAVEQNRLRRAERELLDQTLKKAVETLGDVLGLAAPTAFSRCGVLRSYVTHMMRKIPVEEPWMVEIAAGLALIGVVSVPDETLARYYAGQPLKPEEEESVKRHPEVGARLLARIPRMEKVADIIRCQNPGAETGDAPRDVRMGAAMLRVAHAVDRLVLQGRTPAEAVEELLRLNGVHDRECLEALADYREPGAATHELHSVMVHQMAPGMVLDEDVRTQGGMLVVGKGHRVTPALMEKLLGFHKGVGLQEPIRVRVERMAEAA